MNETVKIGPLALSSFANGYGRLLRFPGTAAMESLPDDEGDMAELSREEISYQIAASEARAETKIARMEGKLDLVLSKLDDVKADGRATRANTWLVGGTLALLIVALVTFFPIVFDLGAKLRDVIALEVIRQVPSGK